MRLRTALVSMLLTSSVSLGSDHLDGPRVLTNPAADIADLFAWPSSDGQRLNLVMTVWPDAPSTAKFSSTIQYVFHLKGAGVPATEKNIICQFDPAQTVQCWVGADRYLSGDASGAGLSSPSGDLKIFTERRDDPAFFFRTGFTQFRGALQTVLGSATFNQKGCWNNAGAAASGALLQMLYNGSQDSLAGQKVLALVLSLDKALVTLDALPTLQVHATTRVMP